MLFRNMNKVSAFEKMAFNAGLILSAVEREALEVLGFNENELNAVFVWEWKKEELRREAFERKNDNRILKAKRDDLDKLY